MFCTQHPKALGAKRISKNRDFWRHFDRGERCYNLWFTDRCLGKVLPGCNAVRVLNAKCPPLMSHDSFLRERRVVWLALVQGAIEPRVWNCKMEVATGLQSVAKPRHIYVGDRHARHGSAAQHTNGLRKAAHGGAELGTSQRAGLLRCKLRVLTRRYLLPTRRSLVLVSGTDLRSVQRARGKM